MLSYKSANKRRHKDGLTVYFTTQLQNQPRTLRRVARVFQKIMKTLYDANFPNAEAHRPGPIPACRDSDILTISWLLEYIGADSENSGYARIQAELKTVFSVFTGAVAFQSPAKKSLGCERSPASRIDAVFPEAACFYRRFFSNTSLRFQTCEVFKV